MNKFLIEIVDMNTKTVIETKIVETNYIEACNYAQDLVYKSNNKDLEYYVSNYN